MKIREELALKYNQPVPRYTSYPPANRFGSVINTEGYLQALDDSNHWNPANISFYIHIPFCRKLCFYCGCNSCRMKEEASVNKYFEALINEISIVTGRIDGSRKISQIHFGGGTPNSVPVAYLERVIKALTRHHSFIDSPEIAIECHPALLDREYVRALREAGFNRFSLGIQDFNSAVLKMINRDPSALPVDELMHLIREGSDNAINLDFIYGLPGQTPESFADTLAKAASLKPDRLVTFSYAHVPWVNKNQMKLEKHGLPDALSKIKMYEAAFRIMTGHGYRFVGLDHYVAPGDELDVAADSGTLHRNFQGYSTLRTTGQVYAFGASGISQLGRAYIQNSRPADEYAKLLMAGKLASERGHFLTNGEIYVREAIDMLMCNRTLDIDNYFEGLTQYYRFNGDMEAFRQFEKEDIINISDGRIKVNENGVIFIRNIAALLDPMFGGYENSFSKAV